MTKNPYITTFTGRRFHFFRTSVREIHIHDIAHALARQPRFCGHTHGDYNVAAHCVILTRYFMSIGRFDLCPHALLHDSAETWFLDMPTPLKYSLQLSEYRMLEKSTQAFVYRAFGLDGLEPPEVKLMDGRLMQNETFYLRPQVKMKKSAKQKMIPNLIIKPWTAARSEREFLKLYTRFFEGAK